MKRLAGGVLLVLLTAFCVARHFSPHPPYSRAFLTLGTEAAARQERDKAEKYLRRSLKLEPASPLSENGLGCFYEQEGHFVQALAHLQRAAALDPKDHEILARLASLYLKVGDYPRAIEYFQKAIAVPGNERSRGNYLVDIARAYWKNGDRLEAVMVLKGREHLSPAFHHLSQKIR